MSRHLSAIRHDRNRLRVAVVVNEFPVVSETFVVNLVNGLLKRGLHVDILPLRHYHPEQHQENGTEHLASRVRTVCTSASRWRLRAATRWCRMATRQPKVAFRLAPQLIRRSWLDLAPIHHAAALDRPYDIVHCQFGDCGLEWAGLHRLGLCNSRLVVSFRGSDISTAVQTLGQDYYRKLFREADLCLPNCEFFGERLRAIGCEDEKVCVFRSGVALDAIPFQVRNGTSCGPLRVLSVGRLVEKKGFEHTIRAVASVTKTGRPITYRIIGDGPLRTSLQRLIDQLNAQDVIHLEGSRSPSDVIASLPTADVFLACSVTAQNGDQDAPVNVLKEAMASGMPVIGTHHGGIPELITHGREGLLVPERDEQAIQHGLTWLDSHRQDWPAMGRAGRERVENEYRLDTWNDRLVELYRETLKSSPQSKLTRVQAA